ncbi:ATP-binding protein [Pararhizobium sp. O133]|uniref:ATP-binding protein n=1 Tax=Pararhizobium sp. O133 TaxID=3449278 RepID=UPI003F688237
MTDKNVERRREADKRLFASMTADDERVSLRMAEIRGMNCTTPRDDQLRAHIKAMKRSLRTGDKQHKILFVTGESNAGKSRLVQNALAADPAFAVYEDDEGKGRPLLFDDAASPCTQRNFAIRFLRKLGFPVRSNIQKTVAWPEMVNQLCAHRVRFLVIDEAQRTMKINDDQELQEFSDNLITLVDSKDWPIRLILIGVEPLDMLRKRDTQMLNRSKRIKLLPIPAQKSARVVLWLKEVIVDHAGLYSVDLDFEDLAQRLIHACHGNAGSIIELIRGAVEVALWDDRSGVRCEDFAQAYVDRTSCLPHDNIFEMKKWDNIPGGAAKLHDTGAERGNVEGDIATIKPLKKGERPR